MLRLLLILLLWVGSAEAATYYVKTTGNDTTGDGSNGNPWLTVPKGLRSLAAGDTLNICNGSYTISGVYGNIAGDSYGGGAASWATATTIKNCDGETYTITHDGLNMDHLVSTGGISYIIFTCDVLTRCNFRGSGSLGKSGVRLNNAAHHVRFQRMSIRSFTDHGILGGTGGCPSGPYSIEILGSDISLNGDDNNHFEHGVYPTCSLDWIVEDSFFIGNMGFGITFHNDSVQNSHTHAIIRRNYIEGRKTGATSTAYGIEIAAGDNHEVYNNIVNGQGAQAVKLTGCFQFYGPNTDNIKLYNNTCHDVTTGIENNSGVSGLESKNNIFSSVSSIITDAGSGTVQSNNLCPSAGTGCSVTGSPSFVNPGTDFSLQSGSTARDAGTDLSATLTTDYIGTSRPQNGTFDIGAYEYIVVASSNGTFTRGGKGMNGRMR